jgi:NTP pyrophosphatase (non-canonical NTP hydrolase)
MSDLENIKDKLLKFRDDRDWAQFHNPKDLALALSIEASELLETFLWKKSEDANLNDIKEELADVFAYAFMLAAAYDLNIEEIIDAKIKLNEIKYPLEKSKGTSKKYTEFKN